MRSYTPPNSNNDTAVSIEPSWIQSVNKISKQFSGNRENIHSVTIIKILTTTESYETIESSEILESNETLESDEALKSSKLLEPNKTFVDAYRIRITYLNNEVKETTIWENEIERYACYLDKASSELLGISDNMFEETKVIEIEPIKPLEGFFHPFFLDENSGTIEEEARRVLNAIALLHTNWHYRKIYFTCSINLAMANDVDKAYVKGKRLTHAKENYHHVNREAKLMMMIDELLETEYPELRPFYIAPISTCLRPGGEGEVTEETTRSQLNTIKEQLDQGHAVFCLTADETSWHAAKPFSVIAEKLSVNKGEKITFSPALNQLTQNTLMYYQKRYPIPEVILNSLREDQHLKNAIKEVSRTKGIESIVKKEESILDILCKALNDARLLKSWPLRINFPEFNMNEIYLSAVTVRQKGAVIKNLIKKIAGAKERKTVVFIEDQSSVPASLECQQLAFKYVLRIKEYLSSHKLSNKRSTDLASEINRVKVATIFFDSLTKVYSPNVTDEDKFNMQDFYDLVDSAESYAVELRDTRSKLRPILNDLAWEASFLKKTSRFPEASLAPSCSDQDKIAILQNDLISEIEKTYNSKAIRLFHSKKTTFDRIKGIKADNLYQYWLILIAEFRGQGFFSSSVKTALEKILDTLEADLPIPSSTGIRRFALYHATRLLEYVNRRERSLAYKFKFSYAMNNTREHIAKAGEVAYALLKAESPEALYRVLLDASYYIKTLTASTSKCEPETKPMESYNSKGSDLIPIINNMEKDFIAIFRNERPLERKPIDLLWQEAFGEDYLNKKFANHMLTKPQDQLQKRCYEVAREMQNKTSIKKAYQHARMCALADAALVSGYHQVFVRKIREQIGGAYLEQNRRRFPVVYQAQTCLVLMDEIEDVKHKQFKQIIEQQLRPFFTENKSITDLNTTIRLLENTLKKYEGTCFFTGSPLLSFLQDFNRGLENTYPAIKAVKTTNKIR